MAASAYVLIEGAAGRIHRILDELRKIDEVKASDAVTGQYDIIARLEADDIHALGRVTYAKIQMIDGVLRTITCNVIQLD
jgi:DNA-binding Lrp family transcriptional regulator